MCVEHKRELENPPGFSSISKIRIERFAGKSFNPDFSFPHLEH
jgi:hypothetical protein